jgi:hypothetical protein
MHNVPPAYAPLKAHVCASRLAGNVKHKEMIRGFHHLREAWYSADSLKTRNDDIVDQVTIGFYERDSNTGTTGEFCVRWIELDRGKAVPQLRVFDDAWSALAHFSDLLAEMAKLNDTSPSPLEFCELLKRLGLKDLTLRTKS